MLEAAAIAASSQFDNPAAIVKKINPQAMIIAATLCREFNEFFMFLIVNG